MAAVIVVFTYTMANEQSFLKGGKREKKLFYYIGIDSSMSQAPVARMTAQAGRQLVVRSFIRSFVREVCVKKHASPSFCTV